MMTFLCLLSQMLCLMTQIIPADTVAHRLEEQKWLYPQEKVAIATNAKEYAAGDTIRMDITLVDASTLQPSGLSHFVYVELTDPFGKTHKRIKLKRSADDMHGYIALSPDLPEGNYTLTGFTRFMESTGPEYFYSKPVYIYGGGRTGIRPSFSFSQKGRNLRITADLGEESDPAIIELSTGEDKSYTSYRKKRNHTFELKPDEWARGTALVKIGNFSMFVPLPPDSTQLRVSLIPEGGALVPDIVNTVGISISDAFGRGTGMKGTIIDSLGDSITGISTDRYGFGSFRFTPEAGEKYRAVIADKEFPLPQADNNAATLQVNPLRKETVSVVPTGNVPSDAMLLIHCRGNMIYYGAVTKDTPYTFKKDNFLPGVNEISLLDGNLNTISSRSVFIAPDSNKKGETELLLDADIPGFRIQASGFDAATFGSSDRIAIDNIMLASGGWKRYDVPSVIKGEYSNPSADLEIGGEISGIVKTRWRGKPLADAEVSIISNDIDYWNTVRTDSDGRFVFNGVDWPEGTRFVIKVVNSKGDTEDNYSIEEDTYPSVNHIVPPFEGDIYTIKELNDANIIGKLYKWLPEVEVTAFSKSDEPDDITQIYEIIGGRTIDQDYFESRNITTYEAALRAYPGIVIQNGKVMNQGKEIEFWVDGVKWAAPYESSKSTHDLGLEATRKRAEQSKANIMTGGLLPSDLAMSQYASSQSTISDLASSYPFHIVDKIIYLRSSAALIVSNHAAFEGGALMIYTKSKNPGKQNDYYLPLKVISPLGYQKQ